MASSDEPWNCQVTLQFTARESGDTLPTIRSIPFGDIIFDRRHAERRIRQAQHAILNPHEDPLRFPRLNPNALDQREGFSSDCICVNVSGQDQDDLSAVDRPGTRSNWKLSIVLY